MAENDALHEAAKKVADSKETADETASIGRTTAAKKVADSKVLADEATNKAHTAAAKKVADAKIAADDQLIEALQGFTASRSALEDTVQAILNQQTIEREEASSRRVFYYVMAALVVIYIVSHGVISFQQNQQNHKQQQGIARTNERLNECTTPSTPGHKHECYETNQKNTATAIAEIQKAQIKATSYAFECVIDGQKDIEGCVNAKFAGTYVPPETTSTTVRSRARQASIGDSSTITNNYYYPPTTTTNTTVPPDLGCNVKVGSLCLG